MADTDMTAPAMVLAPELIPGHDVPSPPKEGETLAECLAYVVRYVPREHWGKVTIAAGSGAEARHYTGDEIGRLAREANVEALPEGLPARHRT